MLKYTLSILLIFVSVAHGANDFVAGKDYVIINNNGTEGSNAATHVTEFFSYGCPWCYRIEPSLNKWVNQKGTGLSYKKIPVVFNKNWEYYARAYYTVNALGLDSTLNPLLFKTIIKDKHPLNSAEAMVDFFTQQGVDEKTAQSAFDHSPSIDLAMSTGQALMVRYQINAVPAFVINNHYKTDLQMAQTEERLFAILDFLLTQEKSKKT